ncbi:MAG: hypothetical protein AAF493_06115 [Pseudomonadota bacterium]
MSASWLAHPIVATVAVPATVALLITMVTLRLSIQIRFVAPVALGLAVAASAGALLGITVDPVSVNEKFVWVAALAGVVGAGVARATPHQARLFVALFIIAIGLWLFGGWSGRGLSVISIIVGLTILNTLLTWHAMRRLRYENTPAETIVIAVVIIGVLAVATGSLIIGQLGVAIAVAMSVVLATLRWIRDPNVGAGFAFCAVSLAGFVLLMAVILSRLGVVTALILSLTFFLDHLVPDRSAWRRWWARLGLKIGVALVLGCVAFWVNQILGAGEDPYYE